MKIDTENRREIPPVSAPAYNLRMDEAGSILVLTFRGRLTDDVVPPSQRRIDDAMAGRRRLRVVFDLSGLDYLTSVGIGFLFKIHNHIKDQGGRMMFVSPEAPSVQGVLEITKFATVADFTDSRRMAIRALA